MAELAAIVLAGGLGRRMRSQRHKPLHVLCGKPMVLFGIEAAADAGATRVVVVIGEDGAAIVDRVREGGPADVVYDFPLQSIARGSADATLIGCGPLADDELGGVFDDGDVIVMPTDMPLVSAELLRRLVTHHRATEAAATVLSGLVDDPEGDCLVVRADTEATTVRAVVDRADPGWADVVAGLRPPFEVASGIYCFRRDLLVPALRRVRPDNPHGALLLGDVVEVLASTGHRVEVLVADDPRDIRGVNDRVQLAGVEAEIRRRTNERWLHAGVTMLDPERAYIDTTVEIGMDVTLYPGVVLQGATVIERGARIGPDTHLVDTTVGADAVAEKTVAHGAAIGSGARVGPFAVLPEGHRVPDGTDTGTFYPGT